MLQIILKLDMRIVNTMELILYSVFQLPRTRSLRFLLSDIQVFFLILMMIAIPLNTPQDPQMHSMEALQK